MFLHSPSKEKRAEGNNVHIIMLKKSQKINLIIN